MNIKRILTDKQPDRKISRFILLFLFNLVALLPLIIFSKQHYSIDTYGIISNWENTEWYIGSFRFFAALIAKLISFTGHNPILNPLPDILFYIFVGAITATMTTIGIVKLFKNKSIWICLVADLSLLITISNVWYTNILTFPECIAFNAVGLLCCFMALLMWVYNRSVVTCVLSSVLFICAAGTFQQFVSVFSIYTIAILCIKTVQKSEVTKKEVAFNYVKSASFILINSVIYYVLGVLIQRMCSIEPNARASMSLSTMFQNLLYFGKSQHSFLKGRSFFSTEILTVCYLVVAVIWIVSLALYFKNSKKTVNTILFGSSFAMAYLCAYLPGLVTTSHGTRTICALFSVFALFSIGAIALWDNKITKAIICCVLILVFTLNVYKTVDMAIDQIIVNTNEIGYADSVAYEIDKYEADSDKQINQISICYDENADFEGEALYLDYAIQPLLELQLERKVNYIETPDEVYKEYFEGKDWQCYDCQEQLKFENDTLYLCIY